MLMHGNVKVVLVAILLSAMVLGCASPTEKAVTAGDLVYVDYTLRDTAGKVVETTNSTVAKENGIYNVANPYVPYSFIVGSNSHPIRVFDDVVKGMKVNETKANITITPDKAYGDYNASKVITVPLETVTGNATNFSVFVNETIRYNDELVYVAAVGPNNTTAKVVRLSKISPFQPYTVKINENDTAVLDYNHPLAGKTLVLDVTVVALNPSPSATLK
ncbi:FKBP-type peptidyl-prolyl cis-trans isomerase [Methanocella conradii]|uniref:FKBP-type peptidyl-prolyl cis-trans isomerase n=1 Tax=Methanocella conradii TaxID=1175444 RepID=UPI00157D27B9|nr:FKBP-type peptidyl-prolyl cis-trans isomerase [Methanocella conradii]